ncbi:DMT family transporter [Pseudaestuariivita atlantica]|uniref:Transporter n=1 Tax=Pseudaestuariivita atlantica TaxID=1317121 RepID=A0A0L1JJI4_9RHOB|nr:DMT family transporter [Pseudaestuariivita atlantica]KNG91911.1 transporter [Pseudaestuariivita atlantica]
MTLRKSSLIVLVMFLWAACFPLIVAGFAYAPHLTFAALRAFLAGSALVALGMILGRSWPRGMRVWLAIFGIGLGATSLGFLGMFMASEFILPGLATVLANAQPLMAAALAIVVLGERLGGRSKAGLALGFIGILLIAAPQYQAPAGNTFVLGSSYILLAAVGITISNVLIRALAERADTLMAMGSQMLIGGIPLLVGAFLYEDPMSITFSPQFLLILFTISLFGTSLAYWLWSEILRTTELSRANAFAFLVPGFGLAMGVAFFGESIGLLTGLGILVTLVGIAMTNMDRPKSTLTADASAN